MKTIGERIQWARLKAGMKKPAELGGKAGVSRAAVVQWESGETKNLKLEHLFKVADALKVSARWLATGEDTPYFIMDSNIDTGLLVTIFKEIDKWAEKTHQTPLPPGDRAVMLKMALEATEVSKTPDYQEYFDKIIPMKKYLSR